MSAPRLTQVEARDRLGGRMHTYTLPEKPAQQLPAVPVDLGAAFGEYDGLNTLCPSFERTAYHLS